ncbi:MAG: hypothetical protein M3352_03375 [Bacteroidota bacterium]|nr:hypothetical protein [Bacteroidota bacterium]
MRHFFVLVTCIATSCSGQEVKQQNIRKDTIKLYIPKSSKEDFASIEDLKHCIFLNQEDYTVVINEKRFQHLTEPKLFDFLKNNKKEIVSHKLSLIPDRNVSYKRIVDMLDLLTSLEIKNYKIVDVESNFSLPTQTQVIIERPAENIDYNNTSFLTVTFLNENLIIVHLHKSDTLKNTEELDKYLTKNKLRINTKKIFIRSSSETSYNSFKPIMDILQKHEYYKYELITND